MWYLAYNLLLILVSPIIILTLVMKKRCRRGLANRLGMLPRQWGPNKQESLWVHAVSLGEVMAIVPLLSAIRAHYPTLRIVVSTVTETGREAVERRLAGIAEHCYAPLDFPWVVARMINRLNPLAFLFVETELWPNLLRRLQQQQIPAVLVNGRLSSRSFRRYSIIKPFLRQVLSALSLCLMQSERDAHRMTELGARAERVHHTGNIKFDQSFDEPSNAYLSPGEIGLLPGEELIVAGSTHHDEEDALLAAYEKLFSEFSSLVLLLAPRHIERATQIQEKIEAKGLQVVRRSSIREHGERALHPTGPRVVILDSRGELAHMYAHAILTFVGGTLVPIGGHNLLEPAFWGKPVFFGPYTDHCAEVAELLVKAGGGKRVRDGDELTELMARGLRDRTWTQQVGQAAYQAVIANRGAVIRNLELIGTVLDPRLKVDEKAVC